MLYEVITPEFVPFKIMPVEKTKADIENRLISGGFNENEFVVDKKTELPWCNILANPAFGTMVSNNSLGFTYAVNSRENKLTPWDNDTRTDNRGELLLIKINTGKYIKQPRITSYNVCYTKLLRSSDLLSQK